MWISSFRTPLWEVLSGSVISRAPSFVAEERGWAGPALSETEWGPRSVPSVLV